MLGGNTNDGGTLYILKAQTRDADKKDIPVVLSVRQKTEKGWEVVQTVSKVSGNLTKGEVVTGEYNGKPTKNIKLTLRDSKLRETYLLDLTFTGVTRGLFNALLSLNDDFSNVEVYVYQDKDKKNRAGARQNGARLEWRYKKDEMPEVREVKISKHETKWVYEELDEFLEEKLTELFKRVNAGRVPGPIEEIPDSSDVPDLGEEAEDDPF